MLVNIRVYSHTTKLIIIFLFGLATGYLIILNNYILVGMLFLGTLYYFFLSWEQKFILFSLTVFFPLAFSHLGPIREFKWIEMLAPFLCVLFIIEMFYKKRSFFSKKSGLFFIAIGILSLWALISYIKRPVSGQMLFGASYTKAGIRSYYTIFVGIATFLCSFWFFKYKKLNVDRWLILLLSFSLLFGCLRLIGYFENFYIPFLGGNFRYEEPYVSYHRICGLDDMAILGIPVTLALFYKRKWNVFTFFCIVSYLGLVFISGGRSYFFGIMLTIVVYVILLKKRYFAHFGVAGTIGLLLYNIIKTAIPLPNQLNRLLAVKGGFLQQDLYRYHTLIYYWETFKNHTIFGKGIGYLQNIVIAGVPHGNAEFIAEQLMSGGHCAYLSILCTFGIGGGFFLAVMLFGSMYYVYNILKKEDNSQDDVRLALFTFLYLIILSIVFIPGGSGFNSMELWFLSGVAAGILAKDEIKNVELR